MREGVFLLQTHNHRCQCLSGVVLQLVLLSEKNASNALMADKW